MSENPFGGSYWKGKTEYERYLRTSELLELQKSPHERAHPDELLFQCMHQVEELWMKVMVTDSGRAVAHLNADQLEQARHMLERVVRVGALLEHDLRLFETMYPSSYIDIRKQLGAGSGLDSPGFNRLNEIAPDMWAAFEKVVGRRGTDLLTVYEDTDSHPDILAVAEALIGLDAAMIRFKREHIMVVRRIIGMGTSSLRGNPAEMLERSAQLTYFPMLWAVRDRLFIDFKAGPPLPE